MGRKWLRLCLGCACFDCGSVQIVRQVEPQVTIPKLDQGLAELLETRLLLHSSYWISIPTGQWSDPKTSLRMNARFSCGHIRELTKK
jgi:hypothetical protein